MESKINTIDDNSINNKQYRQPPVLREKIQEEVNKLLDEGII